jgi:hypothetical protein
MAWVEEIKPIMRVLGYDPDKLWREFTAEYRNSDEFLRERHPDIWAAWKSYYIVVKGKKLT